MTLYPDNILLLLVNFKNTFQMEPGSAAARDTRAPHAAAVEDCKGDHPVARRRQKIVFSKLPQQRFQNGRELRRMALAFTVFKLENLRHLAAFPGGQLHKQQRDVPQK